MTSENTYPSWYVELNHLLRIYHSRKEMEMVFEKYKPISWLAERAIAECARKDDSHIDGLPTREQIEKIIMGVKATPPKWPLTYRYIYDETGTERWVELSDWHGFVSYMNEEVFKKLGLDKTAKAGPRNDQH